MKKILKYMLIAIGALLVLALLVVGGILFRVNQRLNKPYEVQAETIEIKKDSATLALGKSRSVLCTTCHGADFGGTEMFRDPQLGTIHSANLTSGEGGIGKTYQTEDWVRALRHGVAKSGRPVFVMPAKEYHNFTKEDLSALIAYLQTIPKVDRVSTGVRITAMAKVLVAMGAFGDVINAETIDHNEPMVASIPAEPTKEYGDYLVRIAGCRTCHGPQLNGGKDPNPHAPMGANLTPGGMLPSWGLDGFKQTIRTGVTPLGRALLTEFMPWKTFAKLSDVELEAIYVYLMSQPKLETAVLK
jgi:cytochrome c553